MAKLTSDWLALVCDVTQSSGIVDLVESRPVQDGRGNKTEVFIVLSKHQPENVSFIPRRSMVRAFESLPPLSFSSTVVLLFGEDLKSVL